MQVKDINDMLIKYIEDNKAKNDVDYENSIKTLQQLLDEIKEEYRDLK